MVRVAHGLCSSGLFFLSGLLFDRLATRSSYLSKGLMELQLGGSIW